jgi:PAS domain-containing protein
MQFVISLQHALGALAVIITYLVTIGTIVYKTYKQLVPNSGSSLRDAVDKLLIKVDKNNLATMVYLDNIVSEVPVFTTDNKGRYEWANRAYLNLVGKSMDEIIGNNWAVCIHQQDRSIIEEEWEHTANKSRNFDMTYRLIDVTGNPVLERCQAWGNEKIGYFGVVKKLDDKNKK